MESKKSLPANYTLQQISRWVEGEQVALPNIQRGFVWRPYQVENLWDSILRKFPLGAFVFNRNTEGKLQLLDGQQRATAISLGFDTKTFRDVTRYRIFIDLEPMTNHPQRKFNVRVISRSHPWGYSRTDNLKTLSMASIRKAKKLSHNQWQNAEDKLELSFPYEADLPIPLSWFLNADGHEGLLDRIKAWEPFERLFRNWQSIRELDEDVAMEEFHSLSKRMFDQVKGALDHQRVPALYLDVETYHDTNNLGKQEDVPDEVETMFRRLNGGGTPLTGEELNYSILKTHIDLGLQKRMEDACGNFIRPSRFITIAFRLFQHDWRKEGDADGFSMKIKPKQFQSLIRKRKEDFTGYLIGLIENVGYEGKNLLGYAESILEYNGSQTYALPYLIYRRFSDSAPELLFLLLYRIKVMQDRFKSGETSHRHMLGLMTMMLWMGKGANLRDHRQLLQNLWPLAISAEKEEFWSWQLVQRGRMDDVLWSFVPYAQPGGIATLPDVKLRKDSNIFEQYKYPQGQNGWLWKMFYNKDLLLYAQRELLEKDFIRLSLHLEDTDLPFDLDHLFAQNLIRGKKVPALKDIYNTIGNLRAWPYELNRRDNDDSPAQKFDPLSCYGGDDAADSIDIDSFLETYSTFNVQSMDDLPETLLHLSFCSEDDRWKGFDDRDLEKHWKIAASMIINRNALILKEWYQELMVDDLLKEYDFIPATFLDERKWKEISKNGEGEINTLFKDYGHSYQSKREFDVHSFSIRYFFVSQSGTEGNGFLKEGNFELGFFIDDYNGLIERLKDKDVNRTIDEANLVSRYFTLVSPDLTSWKRMATEMNEWLLFLTIDDELNGEISKHFRDSLRKNFLE